MGRVASVPVAVTSIAVVVLVTTIVWAGWNAPMILRVHAVGAGWNRVRWNGAEKRSLGVLTGVRRFHAVDRHGGR